MFYILFTIYCARYKREIVEREKESKRWIELVYKEQNKARSF